MKMKERNTTPAPIQYTKLEVCELIIIWPTSESGIERLMPTVTTRGEVSNIAYAQQKSDTKEVVELIYKVVQLVCITMNVAYQDLPKLLPISVS